MIREVLVRLHLLAPRPIDLLPTPDQLARLHRTEASHRRVDALGKQVHGAAAYFTDELRRNHFGEALLRTIDEGRSR